MGHPATDLRRPSEVRRAMLRFAGGILVVLVVLLAASVWISSHMARNEMMRESRERSQALAQFVVVPVLSSGSLTGALPDAATGRTLDALIGSRIEDGSLRRVKIWSPDGTVLWSDEKSIVGQRFPLEDEVRELFGTERSTAELSTLERAENISERGEGPLIEVYAGAVTADGHPVVFEAYFPAAEIQRDSRSLVLALAGLAIGVLVLFAAASWPLALSLAHRVERITERNNRLVRHTLRASDLERRRMAESLHDDVIPDLAGVGYLLPVIDRSIADGDTQGARGHLVRIGDIIRREVVALRGALVDIHPPDLTRDGLAAGLHELVDETASRGMQVELVLPDGADLLPPVASLVYRVVREGLRNVERHAGAGRVRIVLEHSASLVTVLVDDDGGGPTAAAAGDHVGLVLLGETVADIGGDLVLEGSPLGGARLRVDIPLPLG